MSDIIRKFFGKSASTQTPGKEKEAQETLSLPTPSKPLPESLASRIKPAQFVVGIGHSVGMQRDNNEDALYALTTTILSDSDSLPVGLYIIADGMGGHKFGEKASDIAVRAMTHQVTEKLIFPLFRWPASQPELSIQEGLRLGIQSAHQAILQQTPGGGSTMTAALLLGDQLTIAHVGDSRAYLIHPDRHTQVLTRDHSLVSRLVELGQLTPDEAAVHPQRNVLYRALGQGEPVDAEVITMPLPKPAHLLLCSDGLWGVIPEGQLVDIITSTVSPVQACQELVEAANDAGGPDNISAILVHIPD